MCDSLYSESVLSEASGGFSEKYVRVPRPTRQVVNGMANRAEASEPASLEYMEDPYFLPPDDSSTPSFDVAVDELDELEDIVNWPQDDTEAEWRALPDLAESALCIETEFYMDNRRRRLRIFKKKMREVRVTFQDLSKPYLARMSSHTNYKKFLGITPGGSFYIM